MKVSIGNVKTVHDLSNSGRSSYNPDTTRFAESNNNSAFKKKVNSNCVVIKNIFLLQSKEIRELKERVVAIDRDLKKPGFTENEREQLQLLKEKTSSSINELRAIMKG